MSETSRFAITEDRLAAMATVVGSTLLGAGTGTLVGGNVDFIAHPSEYLNEYLLNSTRDGLAFDLNHTPQGSNSQDPTHAYLVDRMHTIDAKLRTIAVHRQSRATHEQPPTIYGTGGGVLIGLALAANFIWRDYKEKQSV